jgi:hypothetical protein
VYCTLEMPVFSARPYYAGSRVTLWDINVKKTKIYLKNRQHVVFIERFWCCDVYNKYHVGVAGATSLCVGMGQILPGTGFLVSVYEDVMPPFLLRFLNILWPHRACECPPTHWQEFCQRSPAGVCGELPFKSDQEELYRQSKQCTFS